MSNLEIVEAFIKNHKRRFKKFALTQLIMDMIEIAVFVVAVLKTRDNQTLFISVTICMIAIMMLTIRMNIKMQFGSFKKFSESGNINREYADAKKALDTCNAKELNYSEAKANFDQVVDTLAEKLKKNEA